MSHSKQSSKQESYIKALCINWRTHLFLHKYENVTEDGGSSLPCTDLQILTHGHEFAAWNMLQNSLLLINLSILSFDYLCSSIAGHLKLQSTL
jgi:hypothetical protein